jgi:Na+/H+-dicarboxylate symporter
MHRPKFSQLHRSLTVGSLVGLGAGIAVGTSLHGLENSAFVAIAQAVEPLGTLWTNALRMTVIPLVVSQLVLAVTLRSSSGSLGRLGGSTLLLFVAVLCAAALFSAVVTPRVLAFAPLDPETTASLRAGLSVPISAGQDDLSAVPNFVEWIQELVPVNPFQAAADGAILPLIVFTIAFALAMTRISSEWRQPLEKLFRAISEAMLVMVRWILAFTPIGVFALALALARQTGLDAVAAVASYVVQVSAELFCFTLLLYPLAVVGGRVRMRDFVQAAAPAQVVAISTRSSLASLPALLDGAHARLGLPTSVAGFVLPMSVATFKISVVISNTVVGLFLARLYGIELATFDIVTFSLLLILLSFAAPGIPSLGVTALPAFMAIGIPIEGVLLLHAVDLIPDVFKTLLNVTGDMTAAVLVNRWAPTSGEIGTDDGSSG